MRRFTLLQWRNSAVGLLPEVYVVIDTMRKVGKHGRVLIDRWILGAAQAQGASHQKSRSGEGDAAAHVRDASTASSTIPCTASFTASCTASLTVNSTFLKSRSASAAPLLAWSSASSMSGPSAGKALATPRATRLAAFTGMLAESPSIAAWETAPAFQSASKTSMILAMTFE